MSVVFVQAISWKSFANVSSFYFCKSEGVVDTLKSQLCTGLYGWELSV